jgi:Tripartite ATP-independent periplasmic transporter, DctM component
LSSFFEFQLKLLFLYNAEYEKDPSRFEAERSRRGDQGHGRDGALSLWIGLSELHYGIVLLIAMGIGAFLPPAGVGFYVACAIMGTDIETAARAMLPYLIVLIIALLIVAFVPWFTVFLPRALGLGG